MPTLKLTIKKKSIPIAFASVFIFILCFENRFISSAIPGVQTIQAYGKMLALVVCWGGFFLFGISIREAKVCIFAHILALICLLSTFLNGGNLISCINTFVPLLLISSFLELNVKRENAWIVILNVWKWLCLLVIMIDIITIINFPEGLYSTSLYTENWFLGYKTERFIYVFPMVIFFGYTDLKKKEKLQIDFYITFMIGFVSCYLSEATSCWVTLLFFLAFFLILSFLSGNQSSRRKQKFLYGLTDYRVGIALYVILLICVLMAENIQFMIDFTAMLGKDVTFSRRSIVWGALISEFIKNPVLGLGYMSSSDYASIVNYAGGTNAHNMVLTILMYGGCIGLIVYVLMFANCLNRINKTYSKKELLLVVGVYAFLIVGVTSSIMVYSVFGFTLYSLLEHEKREDIRHTNGISK